MSNIVTLNQETVKDLLFAIDIICKKNEININELAREWNLDEDILNSIYLSKDKVEIDKDNLEIILQGLADYQCKNTAKELNKVILKYFDLLDKNNLYNKLMNK